MADLPCRMIVVVGVPSGGTSATTGTLTKNGYYNRGRHHADLEATVGHELPTPYFDPDRVRH